MSLTTGTARRRNIRTTNKLEIYYSVYNNTTNKKKWEGK